MNTGRQRVVAIDNLEALRNVYNKRDVDETSQEDGPAMAC
jgi:hypothetical protein